VSFDGVVVVGGAEVVVALDLAQPRCSWCRVWLIFLSCVIPRVLLNLLRFEGLFLSHWWFPSLLRFACLSISGWILLCRHWLFGGGLQAETHLSRFSFYRCPSTLIQWPVFEFWWTDHFWFEIGG
jgi:hypothetical protein